MPRLNNDDVKRIFLAAGFKRKRMGDGRLDFEPRFYQAATAIIQASCFHQTWLGHSGTGAIFYADCGKPKEAE